jgi:hypothetical protein
MNPYPNSGDPNQPNQYPPNQGLTGTPHGGGAQIPPNVPPGYGDQSPYQQPGYQQPPYQQGDYQQPPYQAPYQQTPYPQSKSTIAFDWRYLTAGIGALVSLIAFFLPYYTYGGAGGTYYGITIPSTNYSVTGFQIGRQFLLDVIIALAAIIIALLLQFGNQMFKAPTSPNIQKLANSLNTKARIWGLVLLAFGAFGIFFRFILDLTVLNIWGVGSWLYLLGMIAVTVGGFFVFRPLNSTPTQVPPVR